MKWCKGQKQRNKQTNKDKKQTTTKTVNHASFEFSKKNMKAKKRRTSC